MGGGPEGLHLGEGGREGLSKGRGEGFKFFLVGKKQRASDKREGREGKRGHGPPAWEKKRKRGRLF